MSQEMMSLNGGILCSKRPAEKTVLPVKKKAKYTGKSKRNLQHKARAAQSKKLAQIMESTPSIQTYFQKNDSGHQPTRNCASKFSSKNEISRSIKQNLEDKKRHKRKVPARSTKGHKQKRDGAVSKRPRRLARSSRTAAKAKSNRAEKRLEKKPKKAHLVSTVRDCVEFVRKRIRSCARCSLGQSTFLRDTHKILMCMLENTFETLDGPCTVSHNQAARALQTRPGWRTLSHIKTFLHTGKLPKESRGGKREGCSLLYDEVFRSKASLWVKEQIALHTQRRLRAIRKKGGSKFISQSNLPMSEKTTANVTSATFQQFVERSLLAEFYSEKAVRARAKAAAIKEGMDAQEAHELEESMWHEVSADKTLFTVSDRTARRWLNELGFKHKVKQSKGVYHDGHDRPDVQKYLHQGYVYTHTSHICTPAVITRMHSCQGFCRR